MNNSDPLYRNDRQKGFIKIVEGDQVTAGGWTEGVNWIDYDNDGDLDLFFTMQFGRPNELHENSVNGSFSKAEADDLTSPASSPPALPGLTTTVTETWTFLSRTGETIRSRTPFSGTTVTGRSGWRSNSSAEGPTGSGLGRGFV